ncbi:cytochrome P450 [Pseudomonas sp. 148P]|uniref:Cytochrome P450 n=1 Tax=Pseudomonas ulcerans TaxID=3115852 RepID=A0ABU7HYA9_9PSED|nr:MULTISPECIES: cytochrome P450 [unclassified Pseudomonas]MEE1925166.1 cytochrome P450 [Pseudomonas sp. 147P]MEE1936555.1 cytochrome P450 [Pseudomonas sp. 148P]
MNIALDTLPGSARLADINVAHIPYLDAAPAYEELPAEGGFKRIRLPSGHTAIHLVRHAEVQALLLDNRAIRAPCNEEDGPSFLPTITPPELLLNNDIPDHGRLRKVVARDFSPSGVALLREAVERVTHERIDLLQRQARGADLFSLVLEQVPSTVDCQLLGIPLADRDYYRPLSHTVQIASDADVPELLRQFWGVYDYLTDLVTGARPTLPDGLIQRFVAARHDSEPGLSDKELVGILLGVLIGGDQNILSVLTKAVYVLLAQPALYRRLVDEPQLIPSAVEELLRLLPLGTISTFPRLASTDLEGPWGVIPAGSVIYADAFAANRDPEVFPEPLAIRLDRDDGRHLQFGYGMHNCMGAALARLEITTVLQILVERLPDLRLDLPAEQLPWVEGIILRRPTRLPVRGFTPVEPRTTP